MINMVKVMAKMVKCGKPKVAVLSTVIVMVDKASSSKSSNGIASNREAETLQAMVNNQVAATGTMEIA